MVKQKRQITSSKAPQKTVMPAYVQSESGSPEETPQSSPGSDDSRNRSISSVDQDGDDEHASDQSNSTSSSDGFGRIPIRSRRRFAPEETEVLERSYKKNKRPTNEVKQRLAQDMDTTVARIQIWFQNRRAKEKKQSESSNNQHTSTADQDSNTSSELVDHEATATTRRKKEPKKPENPESSSKQRKKQKQFGSIPPAPHSFVPTGSYPIPYPNFPHAFPSFDSSSAVGAPMPNDNFLYALPPRKVFLPEYEWPPPHFYHQPLQRSFTNEKPAKYVDPKKVVKPEPKTDAIDHKQKATASCHSDTQEDMPETGDL